MRNYIHCFVRRVLRFPFIHSIHIPSGALGPRRHPAAALPGLKGFLLLAFFCAAAAFTARADVGAPINDPSSSLVEVSPYAVTERGPNHRVWKRVMAQTNSLGQTVYHTNSFTELKSGMHHQVNGQWVESNEAIQITADGAAATNAQHQVRFSANVNDGSGSIDLTTPCGKRLRSTIVGLSLFDSASGQNVFLAGIQDSIGQLSFNQVLYTNALADTNSGFFCDIIYTHKLSNFEQDVLIRRQLPAAPADLGMDPGTTRLRVWTEFFSTPEPLICTNMVCAPVPGGNQIMADQSLNFGSMCIGLGSASSIGATTNLLDSPTNSTVLVPVAKQWVHADGRTFLIEEVPFDAVAENLSELPPASGSANATDPANPTDSPSTNSPSGTGGHAYYPHARPANVKQAQAAPMRLAKFDTAAKPGYLLDYQIANQSLTNFTFQSDSTYLTIGRIDFYGTTVLEGGSIIKCAPAGEGNNVHGTLVCLTTPYRKAVFTCTNDDTVGTILPGSTGVPNIEVGTQLYSYNGGSVSNLCFRYGWNGYGGDGPDVEVSNCQFVKCSHPITVTSGATTLGIHNVLITMADSINNTTNSCSCPPGALTLYSQSLACSVEHLTADLGSQYFISYFMWPVNPALTTVALTNSIALTSHFGAYNRGSPVGIHLTTNFVCQAAANPGTLFQSVGAGNYYLATNSTLRGAGTTSINATLLASLKQKTTFPPLWLTNAITADTTLVPQATRDTGAPDYGYLYDPVDYLASCTVSNATLTLTNGVALAYYMDPGVKLDNNSHLVSQGTPTQKNYLVYYNLVQEQPVNLWGVSNAVALSLPIDCNHTNAAQNPSIFLRFTTICAPTSANLVMDTDDPKNLAAFTLQDCEVYCSGAAWQMYGSSTALVINIQNNLFHRGAVDVESAAQVTTRNNLFTGGSNNFAVFYNNGGAYAWTNTDNAFDGVETYLDGTISHNAYLNGAPLDFTPAGSDITTNITWVTGPLGNYYQQPGSPLFDKGSRTADVAGLYHYTTTTNQVKEAGSTVDIGYHLVALGTNGLPVSTSGGGLGDYLKDRNGNGNYEPSIDTGNWQSSDTIGDGISDAIKYLQGRNLNVGTVSDTNGIISLQVYTPLK